MFGHRFSSIIASRLVIVSVVILAVLLICSSELASGNQPPSFIELFPPSFIFLNESTDVGSTVLQLKAEDVDDPFVNFDLQPVNIDDNNLLTLRRTGVKSADIVLTRKLNYSVSTEHVFKFTVSDLINKPIENRFTIYVRPASFKPPTIDNLPKTITVAEDIPIGTQVYQIQVTDTSSVVTFELQDGGNGSFSIDEMTGIIRNTKTLDYHLQMVHLVTVVVTNRRNLNTLGYLTINITSTKNRPPYFLNSFYEVNIPEGLPQGSSVYQIQAYDGNTDLTKDVSYKIVSGHQNIFTINILTGLVTTSGVIDCFLATIKTSTSCTFNLVIEACQRPLKTAGSSCSTVLLAVSAADVNNHAPTFSLPSYDCFVYKYAPPNTPIGCSQVISVIDDDLGENARFSLSLEPASVSNWLLVQWTSDSTNPVLLIKNNSALINEPSNTIIFKVIAGEVSTAEKRSSTTNINLHLINNNSYNNNNNNGCIEDGSGLMFTSEEYNIIINNLPTPGVSIVNVKVTPSSSAGDVIYNMRGSYKNVFSINDKTGDVTLTRPDLITSAKGVYAFPVTATSVSRSQGFALAIVVVQFDLQALPKAVKMTFENYVALLEENSVVFMRPVIVKAEPTNCNLNPSILYYLTGNGEFDKNFTIDQMSGELKPKSPLDHEALPSAYRGIITLTVGAKLLGGSDSGGSMATVTVVLKDMNDNDPKFLLPSYNFSPVDPLKRGLLGSVAATDADATRPNNQIIYSFSSSLSSPSSPSSSSSTLMDGDFAIDPITGSIYYLSSNPTSSSSLLPTPPPAPRDQTLVVMATDLGTPPRSASVLVTVRYVPEYVTSLSSSCGTNDNVMSAEVNWSSKVNSAVLNVSDSIKRLSGLGYRCHLSNTYLYDGLYRYVEKPQGSEIFTLDSDCSRVRIGISLRDNYRQVRTILSTLSVTNGSSNNQVMSGQRYDVATLIFFINPYTFALDRPTFLHGGADILPSVSSSTADDSLIAKITAVNPLEMDRPIWFSISSRDTSAQSFRINETTGALYFTKNGVDFTKEKSAILTITATSGNPGAILSTSVASADTTVVVHFLPCTRSSFQVEEWIVVGVGRRGERLDLLLVDLKKFTDNWSERTFYNISESMTTVDLATRKVNSTFRTRDLLILDDRGLVTFKGSTGVMGSFQRLEVKVNVSSPSCGSASSAKMLIFSIPDDGFVQIMVDQSEESVAGNYKNLTNQLGRISNLTIFPYAIYRITNESRWSFVIVYCVDMASKELITYPQLARIFDGVNEKAMTEFKNNYKVHAIEQYSGNLTIFPPTSSSSSSSSSSCLPLVIALAVICSIFFVCIVLAVVLFLYFRKRWRHKRKAKEIAVSYSNAMASEYFESNKAKRDEDKDSSTATNSSTTSEFPTTTSNASSSTQNFILKKPDTDPLVSGVTADQGGQDYVYDGIKDKPGPVANISLQDVGTNLITQSSASLAASKFSDSALGSTDFSTARVLRFASRPEDSFDEEEDRSAYYRSVKKPNVTLSPELELGNGASPEPEVDQAQTGGVKSPPSYEQFRSGSLLRVDDNDASDSFYI